MSSRLAKAGAQASRAVGNTKTRDFFYEVCRCLPFIQRIHKLDEILTTAELRAVVKSKFLDYKDVKDPRVTDLLIFKGREELESYMLMHLQRHHAMSDYIEPYNQRKTTAVKPSGNTPFLDSFFTTQYPQITPKY
ncbi:NADH:ubiquinone oxidoreductase B14 subunit [Dunaliella salina]|uniref:NADH:ubiquinone oxidoreductase B14 subunit n=1 Tax=Dunaliella salina TaxID=3046 RepID=A0ABQ7GQ59_DUNSA|nr:NADH:ubiquinone oxidoreductase B14 subunit [Dunaliella salina]|eukprot:KAF5836747.1 NADH:ubiquinone oxidoreductase B14 subunit [Dunaliella salina]